MVVVQVRVIGDFKDVSDVAGSHLAYKHSIGVEETPYQPFTCTR